MALLKHLRGAGPSRPAWRIATVLAAMWVMVSARVGLTQPPLEDEVKAVFLFNFAKYVDWPSAPQGTSDSIRVCVPANPAFLAVVREAVRDEIVNGRPITAVSPSDLDAARHCDILYVGTSGTPDARAWTSIVSGRPTLTVGEGRMVDGLVIAFVRDQDRLRFDVNRAAAAKQGLAISSRLLGLARRVTPP